jgi:hypothetical protein
MQIPGLEGVDSRVVEGGETVTQIARPGAEGKLHDDGAVFHLGRNAVIEFADVAERSGCETGERSRWKKVANFHWGGFAKSAATLLPEEKLLTSRRRKRSS